MARIKGLKQIRRVVSKLPDTLKANVSAEIRSVAQQYLAAMKSEVRRKTGFLARGLKIKFTAKGLKARIGFVGDVQANSPRFYGRILEFGRKSVYAHVRRRNGDGTRTSYYYNTKARAPEPVVTKKRPGIRLPFLRKIEDSYDIALRALTLTGAGDDS